MIWRQILKPYISIFQTPVEKKKLENLLSLYQPAIFGCKWGPDYGQTEVQCPSDDVSDFARDSAAIGERSGLAQTDGSGINFGKRW